MSSPAPLLPPGEAANADVPEPVAQSDIDSDDPGHRVNPLLAVVVGMAFMFGVLALLLAFG